jgi:hypothetical protein
VATSPTFTRRAINALVAQARGNFAIYRYTCSKGTHYMLHDKSPGGLWSHMPHQEWGQCLANCDKEAAAAPYATDFLIVGGKDSLLSDLRERGPIDWDAILGNGERRCTDSGEHALRVCLFWLKEMHGVRIERDQVISDLPND